MAKKVESVEEPEVEDFGLGDFDDAGFEAPQKAKWQFTGLGYNSKDGKFYLRDEQVSQLKDIVLFAIRQWKEVKTQAGTYVYSLWTKATDMVPGDIEYKIQALLLIDGEFFVLGGKAYNVRASLTNPQTGTYHNNLYNVGIWTQLVDHIDHVKSATGKTTSAFCWQFDIGAQGSSIRLHAGGDEKSKEYSEAYPFTVVSKFSFVGADRANEYKEMWDEQDVQGWINARQNIDEPEVVAPTAASDDNFSQPTIEEDDIPF